MIQVMVGFFKGMFSSLAKPWWVWIAALMAVNLASLFFIGTIEGKVVLGTFMVAAGIQMTLFKFLGFVRLLGLGHFVWFPLLFWLWGRQGAIGTETAMGQWLTALFLLNGISLVIDVVDVVRYLAGDRQPSYVLESPQTT